MAAPLTIIATTVGLLGTALGITAHLRGQHAARETALPPPPSSGQHAGSLLDGNLDAIRGRLTALETREERAQSKREEMAETLTRIETKLDERTSRRKDPHASRESQ